tara:strand:- start:6616 stop:8661 length:2046 start_codon:yes stop_codon:yes gene_type:complete
MEKYDEETLDIISRIEQENKEAAKFKSDLLIEASEGSIGNNYEGLDFKLRLSPLGEFSISEYSKYKDDRWKFVVKDGVTTKQIIFNSDLLGFDVLKKLFVFHYIPAFNPFCTIRSFESTCTYAHAVNLLKKYVFEPNGLTALPEDINLITARMLNDALDAAKKDGAIRHYHFLFFTIRFWLALTTQSLISSEFCLDVNPKRVDNIQRKKDVINHIETHTKGWEPYSADEIESLITYSKYWLEDALPVLVEASKFINKKGLLEKKQSEFTTCNIEEQNEFESIFGRKVSGKEVIGYSKRINSRRTRKRDNVEVIHYSYSWKNKFEIAIDRVRNGLFILIALLTGLRKSEISCLTLNDIYFDGENKCQIDITRFKTTRDPNFFGEIDTLPLPEYVGECFKSYKSLRSLGSFFLKGLLFQPVSGTHEVNLLDRMISKLSLNLRGEVGLDSIHLHRFRKTIAEILIHRSEKNIDLIRMLFGHSSYQMTLKYIARNPYVVESISEVLEQHFTQDFIKIITAISQDSYSGPAAESLSKIVNKRPEKFKGKLIRFTISQYVEHILESGQPLFISRTMLGQYCFSNETFTKSNVPPCLKYKKINDDGVIPDINNCKVGCEFLVVTKEAEKSLIDNIDFYQTMIINSGDLMPKKSLIEFKRQIKLNEKHLSNLNLKRKSLKSQYKVRGDN